MELAHERLYNLRYTGTCSSSKPDHVGLDMIFLAAEPECHGNEFFLFLVDSKMCMFSASQLT